MVMNNGQSKTEILESDGWAKRFIAREPRLSEATDMYKESGFEVHLEPLPQKKTECDCCPGDNEEDECRICFEGFEDQYTIIFTRPRKDKIKSKNNLF